MFGAHPSSLSLNCITFVSKASVDHVKNTYNLRKQIEPVKNCRNINKADMKMNSYLPNIQVDPETYKVTIDDQVLYVDPAKTLPMTRNAFMF